MKYQRSNNLGITHNHLRDLTWRDTQNQQRDLTSKDTYSQTDQRPPIPRRTPHKSPKFRDTHSQAGQRLLALAHTPTHRSEASTIRHTHKHIPRMWTDNRTETSQLRTLYLFLIAVVTNHHDFRVMEKHKFITLHCVGSKSENGSYSIKVRCEQSCVPSGDSGRGGGGFISWPFPVSRVPVFLAPGPFFHLQSPPRFIFKSLWFLPPSSISSLIRAPCSHVLHWTSSESYYLAEYRHRCTTEISRPRTCCHDRLKDFTSWGTHPQTPPSSDHCIWLGLCRYFSFSDNRHPVPLILGLLWLHWTHLENLRKSSHLKMCNLITPSKYLLTCKVTSSRMVSKDYDTGIFRRP